MTCRTIFQRINASAWETKLIIGSILAFVFFEAGWMLTHRPPATLPEAVSQGELTLDEYSNQNGLELYATPRDSSASLLPPTDKVFGQVSVTSADGDFVGGPSCSSEQLAEEFTGIPTELCRTDRISPSPSDLEAGLPTIRVPGRFRVKMPDGHVSATVSATNSFPGLTFEAPAESGFAFKLTEESQENASQAAGNSNLWEAEFVPLEPATGQVNSIDERIVADAPLADASAEASWDDYPSTSYEAVLPQFATTTQPALSRSDAANGMLKLTEPQASFVAAPTSEPASSGPMSTILKSGVRVSDKIAPSLPGSDILPTVTEEMADAHGMIQNPFVR